MGLGTACSVDVSRGPGDVLPTYVVTPDPSGGGTVVVDMNGTATGNPDIKVQVTVISQGGRLLIDDIAYCPVGHDVFESDPRNQILNTNDPGVDPKLRCRSSARGWASTSITAPTRACGYDHQLAPGAA
jgi:hypothetical protein